ncbi:helix-turn-helix transcriptional regulator [Roseinatronobacter sp. NSM]|uniref:helix-turn-helix transcriptional regulator n=1 Tax=Roseinatronobacter sp. NSM TaxID=3457785 RepID=UPI0040364582
MDDPVAFAKLVARELADGYAAGRYAPPPEYLNTAHAAAYLGLTPGGMETMRKEGRGPAFIRASGKLVRYRVADLNDWMAQHRVEPGEVSE